MARKKPDPQNYLYAYYQAIKNGSVTVCKWTEMLYDKLISGIQNKEFFFDQKKALMAVTFIENFAHHHEGAMAPQKFKLELWSKAMVSAIFGIVDKTGARQFREVFTVVARKNSKTLLAAAIAEYCAFCDGEYGGQIYFAAPKLQQAGLGFHAFEQSIKHEPLLEKMIKKRRTDIYIEQTNTVIMPLAFSAKKSDGFNVSCAILDEIASWQGDAGLKFYEVLKSSQASRRQGLMISISTAGYIDEGIYDELMRRSTRYLKGDSKESRLLPFLYLIDDPEKWNDINELAKSNPNLGVSVPVGYLLEEIAVAEGSLSKKAEFLTKYCNVKQNSSLAWLDAQLVQNASGKHFGPEDLRDSYCVAGIDLSQTRDLTAAVVIVEKNGELYVLAKFWLPRERIQEAIQADGLPYDIYIQRGLLEPSGDNFIDYEDCYRWLTELVEKYQILPLKIGYDRYSSQYLVQSLKTYGFHTDDVFQGDNLYPMIQEWEGLMMDGKVHIGDNDLLKVHMLNAAVKMSIERGRGKLVKINPAAHIDGMAAILDAMTMRSKYAEEISDQLRNEG